MSIVMLTGFSSEEKIYTEAGIDSSEDHIERHHFHFLHHDTVRTEITAINNANSSTHVSSTGYLVDLTPAKIKTLVDGEDISRDLQFTVSTTNCPVYYLHSILLFIFHQDDMQHPSLDNKLELIIIVTYFCSHQQQNLLQAGNLKILSPVLLTTMLQPTRRMVEQSVVFILQSMKYATSHVISLSLSFIYILYSTL